MPRQKWRGVTLSMIDKYQQKQELIIIRELFFAKENEVSQRSN
jgi:hypothetical protein